MRRSLIPAIALILGACAASPAATPDHNPPRAAPLPRASASVAPIAITPSSADPDALPPEVRAFVHDHAHPLRSLDPGGARGDLAWLRELASRARVVGLGEQTHGTHEHARLKQRLIEMLVRDAGYTALVIEAPMLEIADLDADVNGGPGDLGQDAVSLGFWSWKIDEMIELLGWIRAHNAEPTTTRKVSVYGCDLQKTPRATSVLLQYLDRVDPARARRLRPVFATLVNPFAMADYAPRWRKDVDAISAALAEIQAFLAGAGAASARKTDEHAWSTASLAARLLTQFVETERVGANDSSRDRFMAENVGWALEHEGPDGKVMVWAHNGHVTTRAHGENVTLGSELRRALETRYLPIGLFFDEGSFRAFSVPRAPGDHTRTFAVGPAPGGTFEAALRAGGSSPFGLSLADAPAGGPVPSWLDEPHRMRSIGWSYMPEKPESAFGNLAARGAFDVVFYTGTSSPTHAVERLEEDAFADGSTWSLFGRAFGYALSSGPGADAFGISRASGPATTEAFGGGRRRLSAVPWRGQTLRASFTASAAVSAKSGAWVWVRASQSAPYRTKEIAHADARVSGAAKHVYEVSLEVPSDADTLDLGLALVGDGQATLEGASLSAGAAGPLISPASTDHR